MYPQTFGTSYHTVHDSDLVLLDSRKSVQEGKMDMREWGAGRASQLILFPMIPCCHWKVRSSDISCRATHETDLARAGCKWI